jgi:hypothetical protein
MKERVKPPAIEDSHEDDLRVTAKAVRQLKRFLESPTQVAAYISDLIRNGMIDTGGAPAFWSYTSVLVSSLLGYRTGVGAGGAVTQVTSKATGVTLNTPTGRITTHTAALAAGASAYFVCTNSSVGLTDVVLATTSTDTGHMVTAYYVAAGSFGIRLTNLTAGSLSLAVAINFVVLKGASS